MSSKYRCFFITLLGAEVVFLGYALIFFYLYKRLPAPFFYNAADSFMDFFNTNFWAFSTYKYLDWHSIYPIFSFAVAQLLSPNSCGAFLTTPFDFRDCAEFSIVFLFLIHGLASLLLAVLVVRELKFDDFLSIAIVFFSILLSLPGLYALERGNYIILSFIFLVFYRLTQNKFLKLFFLMCAVNIKQYILVVLGPLFLKKEYGKFIFGILLALAINYWALFWVVDDNYLMLFSNMLGFADGNSFGFFEKMWYSNSFSAWVKVVESDQVMSIFSDFSGNILYSGVYFLRIFSLFCGFVSILKIVKISREIESNIIEFSFLLFIIVLTESLGGYATLLLLPYLSVWLQGAGRLEQAVFLALIVPLDFTLGPFVNIANTSFLGNEYVHYSVGLTLGSYVRPFASIGLLYLFVCRVTKAGHNTSKLDRKIL